MAHGRLVDQAVRAARTGQSSLMPARAHALRAEPAARAGHERQAQTALGLAWYDVEADHSCDPAPMSFSAGHVKGFEGLCELYIGDAAEAHDRFAQAAGALRAPREQVQRAIMTTDQALARIQLGEPRAAADLLHGCVAAASTTGGRVPALRLRRARRELRPWRREDWVAEPSRRTDPRRPRSCATGRSRRSLMMKGRPGMKTSPDLPRHRTSVKSGRVETGNETRASGYGHEPVRAAETPQHSRAAPTTAAPLMAGLAQETAMASNSATFYMCALGRTRRCRSPPCTSGRSAPNSLMRSAAVPDAYLASSSIRQPTIPDDPARPSTSISMCAGASIIR